VLINIVRWRVPKEKSSRQLEIWQAMMDRQRAHPEKVTYTRSRFFTFSAAESSEEDWMFLDEYERREDYDRWMKAVREDPELISLMESFFPEWEALVSPGSKQGEVWTEVESLRAEFKQP
jgi:nicotinamidase-related amidase